MLTRVADGVLIHQSQLLQNNTVVVEGPDGVLLIDAGVTGSEMTCLARDLHELGQAVVAGFATHPDWDHVLWHGALGEAPRYATSRGAEVMRDLRLQPDWQDGVTGGLPPEITDDVPLDRFGLIAGLAPGTVRVPWDGPEVGIVEHPAHSPGHAALVIGVSRVLVAGDMLSDVFIPMLGEVDHANDPIDEYLEGLRRLEGVADEVDFVVPGHGSVARGEEVRSRIELDRLYVVTLRDGGTFDDPRIGGSAQPGWEWVNDIHDGQLHNFADGRKSHDGPAD